MAEQTSQPDLDRTAELLLILLTAELFEEWQRDVYFSWVVQQTLNLTRMTQFWFETQEWAEPTESSLVDWPYITARLASNAAYPISTFH